MSLAAAETRDLTPERIVSAYLAACERRDFAAARSYLGARVEMIFPGGRRPEDPEQIAAGSQRRYGRVAKEIEGFDIVSTDTTTIVYCYGTLHGEWRDGERFAGIRFLDRFVLAEGKIVSQKVWNDAGEAMLSRLSRVPPNAGKTADWSKA